MSLEIEFLSFELIKCSEIDLQRTCNKSSMDHVKVGVRVHGQQVP